MYFADKSEFVDANCHGATQEEMDWFHSKNEWAKALKICNANDGCPAKESCLALALREEVVGDKRYGVFGGMSAAARTKQFG